MLLTNYCFYAIISIIIPDRMAGRDSKLRARIIRADSELIRVLYNKEFRMERQKVAQYTILQAPSRESLFDSLRLIGSECRPSVTFKISEPSNTAESPGFKPLGTVSQQKTLEVTVFIMGLKPEDGSGNNWLFEAYIVCAKNETSNKVIQSKHIEGYCNTERRSGHLTLFQDV